MHLLGNETIAVVAVTNNAHHLCSKFVHIEKSQLGIIEKGVRPFRMQILCCIPVRPYLDGVCNICIVLVDI